MKIFKNYRTKRQLREEIERLKRIPVIEPIIKIATREIERESCTITVDSKVSFEIIKDIIAKEIAKQLMPYMEYMMEEENGKKIVTGSIHIAKKKQ